MLLRLACFTLILSLFSCSKPTKEPLVGSVSFSVNGTSHSWTEQQGQTAANANSFLLMNIYTSTAGTYHFNVSNAASIWLIPAKEIFLTFPATTLTMNTPFTLTNTVPATYPYPHSVVIYPGTGYDPSAVYNASATGDFATVTITSLHDGRADGSFSARLTRVSDLAIINITNGTFKNVEITP